MRALADRRLGESRDAFAALDPAAAPAFLPLASVGPELQKLRRAENPFAPPAEPSTWRRLLRLWRMSRRAPPF
jgi:hypothetical protein